MTSTRHTHADEHEHETHTDDTHDDELEGKGCLDHDHDSAGTADGGRRSLSEGKRYGAGRDESFRNGAS